jgi:PAS domain-containing protein
MQLKNAIDGSKVLSDKLIVDILESITDCFFALDEQWTILFANTKVTELFQVTPQDVLGKISAL